MAKTKRSILDDIASGVRELVNDLERLLNPQPKKPARALVPIPVRKDPRPKRYPPYR